MESYRSQIQVPFDLTTFRIHCSKSEFFRSLCSLVCKWTYEINPDGTRGWNERYFQEIGLKDLLENNCEKIGNVVLMPGTPCGSGLKEKIAQELGLIPGTPVGTSIIDAHAGGLGMIGCSVPGVSSEFDTRLGKLLCVE